MRSDLWYAAANIEDLYDSIDEAFLSSNEPEPSTCIRCQTAIDPESGDVFCDKCYDYLDERGCFEP